jgi:hypothetical protein
MSEWGREGLLIGVRPNGFRDQGLRYLAHLLDGTTYGQFTKSEDSNVDFRSFSTLLSLISRGRFSTLNSCWLLAISIFFCRTDISLGCL